MTLALEQAGSSLAGWVNSCLSCLVPAGDDESCYHHDNEGLREHDGERELKICHDPPHLIPPMDLGVSNGSRRQKRPDEAASEDKGRMSRTSIRPSPSLRKKPPASRRISGPWDFRKVESLLVPDPSPFSPLQLSIHSPGSRLSNLPNFEDFQLDEARLQPIAPPARVLSFSQSSCSRSSRPGSTYQLMRKPVRSGARKPSLATLDKASERRIPVTDPLIPHFSNRSPAASTAASVSENAPSLTSRFSPLLNSERDMKSIGTQTPSGTETPKTVMEDDGPLPPLPAASPPASFRRRPLQTPEHYYSSRPPSVSSKSMHSARITTHCFSPAASSTKPHASSLRSPPTPSRSIASTDRDNARDTPPHSRARRLSGSTLASSPSMSSWTTSGGGGFKKTPSLASSVTARPSFQDSRTEKECEVAGPSRSYVPKYVTFPSPLEELPYSTIYEGLQPQSQTQQQQQDCERKYGYNGNNNGSNRFYSRYRESGIGLAF
ncbi:hypothetical protein PHISP_04942 [Aspergillus sp. HF37]|nr:hypothetical protein PHISP_04942 [Aspergillus sp. HF37]